jgi:transcriptional regulator with XRE-family HTH domain
MKKTRFFNKHMSNIANALDTELKLAKKTGAELARASGVNEAQISRIKTGDQVWVSPEDLNRLANGLYPKQTESAVKCHARLLHAHVLDECTGPGADLISIALKTNPSPKLNISTCTTKSVLPPAVQQNLDVIAENISENRHVRDFIQTIADFCRNPIPQAQSK